MRDRTDPIALSRKLSLFSRSHDFLYAGLLCGITSHLASYSWSRTVLIVLHLFGLYTLAVIYNNRHDYKIDKVNRRVDNPIVLGQISQRQLHVYTYSVYAVVILSLLLLGSFWLVPLSLAYIILLLCYSHPTINVQSRGIYAFLPLVLCYGCIPILLGVGNFSLSGFQWVGVIMQPVLLIPMLLAKDYKDKKGDSKYGKKTFLVRHGAEATFRVSLILAASALIVLTFLIFQYDFSKFLIVLGLIYVTLIAKIHRQRARVHPEVKRLVFVIILIISVIILQK